MANYSLGIKQSAAKELERLPVKDRSRIITRIQSLGSDPRPPGSQKLSNDERYRIRQGNYRILYQIDDNEKTVIIVKIGHRREVYG